MFAFLAHRAHMKKEKTKQNIHNTAVLEPENEWENNCRSYATEKYEEKSVNVSWFCHFAVKILYFFLFSFAIIEFSPHEMSVFPINICFIKPWFSPAQSQIRAATNHNSPLKGFPRFQPNTTTKETGEDKHVFPERRMKIVWWKWWNMKDILNIRFVYLLAINT